MDKLIDKWFVKIKTPNSKAGLYKLLSMWNGYYRESMNERDFKDSSTALHNLKEDLKNAGFTTLRKNYYYNISFSKIKEALKPVRHMLKFYSFEVMNFRAYQIGYLLRLYDNGFRFTTKENNEINDEEKIELIRKIVSGMLVRRELYEEIEPFTEIAIALKQILGLILERGPYLEDLKTFIKKC